MLQDGRPTGKIKLCPSVKKRVKTGLTCGEEEAPGGKQRTCKKTPKKRGTDKNHTTGGGEKFKNKVKRMINKEKG